MTRTAEDARRDPQPGDVFRKGKTQRRVSSIRCDSLYREWVEYQVRRSANFGLMRRSDFLEWAADAEVLEVAE